MKKYAFPLLTICLSLFLTACGSDASSQDDAIVVSEDASTNNEVKPLSDASPQINNSQESSATNESIDKELSNKPAVEVPYTSKGPDDIELMSYAQTVLENFFPECKYSRRKDEYTFVNTNLRYKIEGEISKTKDETPEKFYMIIAFTNEEYESYDLISLQVGDELIYESPSKNDLPVSEKADTNEILSESNTKIYNEVIDRLNSEYDRPEDEILEEIAPNYGMSAAELKEFLNEFMEAYY
jgi:hypothetical protein